MGCQGCGASGFDKKLGKCPFCMWLALASSILFWSLYFVVGRFVRSGLVLVPLALFASLVTLLLAAHLLAFFALRRK